MSRTKTRHVTLAMPDDRSVEMSAPRHLYIPRVLEQSGLATYETDTLAAVLAALAGRDGVFVDVGANVGVFSLVVAAVTGVECLAFEPLPDAAEVLATTAARSRLPISVSRAALSDRAGQATFYVSAKSDASSGLDASFRAASASFDVELARLDDVLADRTPAVIKIDTETTEPAVLAGAARTIEAKRPWLVVEVLHGRTEPALEAFFRPRGYHWYQIDGDERWRARSSIVGDPTYAHANWLFCPTPPDEAFWWRLQQWRAAFRRLRTAPAAAPAGGVGADDEAAAERQALDTIRSGKLVELLRRHGGRARGLHILDAGCGTGQVTDLLRRCGHRVVGIDRRAAAIATASDAFGPPFAESELERYAPAAPFDVVVCLDALPRIVDDDAWRAAVGALGRYAAAEATVIVADLFPEDAYAPSPDVVHRRRDAYDRAFADLDFRLVERVPCASGPNALQLAAYRRAL